MAETNELSNEGVIDIQPVIKQGELPYNKINRLSQWVMSGLDLHGEENKHGTADEINTVVNRVADCLPIEEGYGNATISDQLDFWDNNQQLFTTAFEKRQSAADLIDSREKIIGEISSFEKDLGNAKYDEMLIKFHFVSTVFNLRRLARLRSQEVKSEEEIAKRKPELRKTDAEFEVNKQLLKSVTSKIDCKLPAIITGEILKELGWDVSLLCFNHPEHPSVLASIANPNGTQTGFLIDYNSTPSKFRGDPNIRKISDQRYITSSRVAAMQKGFISQNESWPLPFSEETFKKFDSWYIDHVESSRK